MNNIIIILLAGLFLWLIFGVISYTLNKKVKAKDITNQAQIMETERKELFKKLYATNPFSSEYIKICEAIKEHDEKYVELFK